jgi:hypothetical protein
MPTPKPVTVDCPVEFSTDASPFGQFANAVRLVPEGGQECFLDFCVYSAQEKRAKVVSRVRIHRSFLPAIQRRIEGEIALDQLRGRDDQTQDEKIVFLKPPMGEPN